MGMRGEGGNRETGGGGNEGERGGESGGRRGMEQKSLDHDSFSVIL